MCVAFFFTGTSGSCLDIMQTPDGLFHARENFESRNDCIAPEHPGSLAEPRAQSPNGARTLQEFQPGITRLSPLLSFSCAFSKRYGLKKDSYQRVGFGVNHILETRVLRRWELNSFVGKACGSFNLNA